MQEPAGTAVVIEDDDDIRQLIQSVLEQRGLSVFTAATGRGGLDLVREKSPDIVTLDLGLPDIEGFEVCRRLRAMTDAYVIMVSASAAEVDQLLALEIGADDYITKPFSPRDLRARVGAMLRRPRGLAGPSADELSTSDETRATDETSTPDARHQPAPSRERLVVDLAGREALLDGVELTLTRIEFDLLGVFVTQPKRVWSREALLRRVWRSEWAQDTHLVEVHVGNLRRKLGAAHGIRTVRGVGYRFDAAATVLAPTAD